MILYTFVKNEKKKIEPLENLFSRNAFDIALNTFRLAKTELIQYKFM